MVALNDDFAILYRASDTALRLQQTTQLAQIILAALETLDKGHDLAAALLRVAPYAQVLLRRRQRLGFGLLVGHISIVGVGRVDHSQS